MLLPDFLNQAAEFLRQLFVINPSEPFITGAKLVSMGGTAVTVGAVFVSKTYPWLKAKFDSRSISKSVGAKLFSVAGIERSLRYYIPPFCQSVDPAGGEESRLIHSVQAKLFDTLDNVLNRTSNERYHILLADSGMGKTSALLNYYSRHLHRWRKPCKLAIVPLGIADADERIKAIEDKEGTALFLDAFDEDTLAMVDHAERLRLILKETNQFYRVLITSRTQFFAKDEEIPRETGVMKVAAREAGESAEYVFYKVYLTPFTDDQIARYLKRRYSLWHSKRRKRAFQMAKKIPHLTARPMLLAHIDDLVKTNREIRFSYELYEEMVEAWIRREQGFIEEPSELRRFSELLAVNIYTSRQARGSELLRKDELLGLAKEWNVRILDDRLSGRSLLNRDADGNFKFAHRSIMEYLFVRRFASGDDDCRNIEWTDNMKRFLVEMVSEELDSHLSPEINLHGADLTNLTQCGFRPRRNIFRNDPERRVSEFDLRRSATVALVYRRRMVFSMSAVRDVQLVFEWIYGLMWQRSGSEHMVNRGQAEAYVSTLNAQRHCGYDDWRLPTFEEALLGCDSPESQIHPSSIEFFDRKQTRIWTSQINQNSHPVIVPLPHTSLIEDEWFDVVTNYPQTATSAAFVRAVRSAHANPVFGHSTSYRPVHIRTFK